MVMNAVKRVYMEFNFMALQLVAEHEINIYIHGYLQN